MLRVIHLTGVANITEVRERIVYFDSDYLSFPQQVQIMQDTDIFISPHGSGLQNLIFLEKVNK